MRNDHLNHALLDLRQDCRTTQRNSVEHMLVINAFGSGKSSPPRENRRREPSRERG